MCRCVPCRYYAILKPMKARYTCTLYHAKKLVIIIWVASFVLALPIIRGQVNVLVFHFC